MAILWWCHLLTLIDKNDMTKNPLWKFQLHKMTRCWKNWQHWFFNWEIWWENCERYNTIGNLQMGRCFRCLFWVRWIENLVSRWKFLNRIRNHDGNAKTFLSGRRSWGEGTNPAMYHSYGKQSFYTIFSEILHLLKHKLHHLTVLSCLTKIWLRTDKFNRKIVLESPPPDQSKLQANINDIWATFNKM